eukprot:gene8096-8754_t
MTTLNDESTIVTMSDESSSRQLFFASPVRTPRKFKRNFQKFGKPFPLKVSRDAGDPISADDADDDESDVEYGAPQSFFSSPYDELRSFSAGSPFTMKQSSNDSEKIGYQFPDFRGKESYDEIERTSSVFHEESPLKQRIPTITTLNQNREDQILASIALDQISIKDDPNDDKNKFVQDPNGEYVVFPTRQLGTLTIPTTKPMPHPNTKSKLPPRPLNTQTLTSNSPSLMSPASDVSDNEHEYFSDTNRSDLLTYVDEEDNPYAEGFLMRLLALGHGGLDKNISKATKYAIKLLPWMKDVIQETEMIPHNTSSMYCKYFLAQYNLALCYELGKGTPINLPLSLKYYQLAAEQDHAVAQYTIGMMYLNGYSSIVSANSELGFYWLQRSSNKGYSKAHTSLGTCYEKGIGVEQNYELAIYYYQLGVDHDDSAASILGI